MGYTIIESTEPFHSPVEAILCFCIQTHSEPVRLIGVRAGKIDDDSFSQLSLFDSPSNRKKKDLEKAVDQIRSKFGVDSIKRASFLKEDSIVDHAASKRKHLNRQEDIR